MQWVSGDYLVCSYCEKSKALKHVCDLKSDEPYTNISWKMNDLRWRVALPVAFLPDSIDRWFRGNGFHDSQFSQIPNRLITGLPFPSRSCAASHGIPNIVREPLWSFLNSKHICSIQEGVCFFSSCTVNLHRTRDCLKVRGKVALEVTLCHTWRAGTQLLVVIESCRCFR